VENAAVISWAFLSYSGINRAVAGSKSEYLEVEIANIPSAEFLLHKNGSFGYLSKGAFEILAAQTGNCWAGQPPRIPKARFVRPLLRPSVCRCVRLSHLVLILGSRKGIFYGSASRYREM
jgi:hypothetical protein